MNRREALKSFALSTGVVISSGTMLGLLQSCKATEPKLAWKPESLKSSEAATIADIADIILPKTETPGAADVSVPQFIDLLFKDVFSDADTAKFVKGLQLFNKRCKAEIGSVIYEAEQPAKQAFVEKLYALSEAKTAETLEMVRKPENEIEDLENYHLWSFLVTMRELTIKTYFTSEYIGEEVLSYDPVPGVNIPCMPVEEVGNVWSI